MDNDSPPAEPVPPEPANAAQGRLYRPTPMQAAILAVVAAAALACGFYLRYQLVEQAAVGVACQSGPPSSLCSARRMAISLFEHSVFGLTTVTTSLLNLYRPSVVLIALALFAGGIGIVLYNVGLSALGISLLILSLARRAAEPD